MHNGEDGLVPDDENHYRLKWKHGEGILFNELL